MDSREVDLLMDKAPSSGPLKDKWTGEQFTCPVCGSNGLDKFTGGPNVSKGSITRTEFIYHCRVCDLNLTEEEFKQI